MITLFSQELVQWLLLHTMHIKIHYLHIMGIITICIHRLYSHVALSDVFALCLKEDESGDLP